MTDEMRFHKHCANGVHGPNYNVVFLNPFIHFFSMDLKLATFFWQLDIKLPKRNSIDALVEDRLKPRDNQPNFVSTNIKMIFGIQMLFSKPYLLVQCTMFSIGPQSTILCCFGQQWL